MSKNPLIDVYRQLYNPDLYLKTYAIIYSNVGWAGYPARPDEPGSQYGEIKPVKAFQHLTEAEGLTAVVQQELTGLIQQLRPLALEDKGLTLALEEYLADWSRQHSIAAETKLCQTSPRPAPLVVEEALWRVA